MVRAAVLDGLQSDAPLFGEDGFAATEVDIRRCEVADGLVVAVVVVPVDESGESRFRFALEEVVFQKDVVLEGLVPAFDFAMGLREPEIENQRKRRAISDLARDKLILTEATRENF